MVVTGKLVVAETQHHLKDNYYIIIYYKLLNTSKTEEINKTSVIQAVFRHELSNMKNPAGQTHSQQPQPV